ncbi:MAG TPA: BamA/TamA family outer membrane protein, partial [Verrucomicrobiae bacterium]|nr:BamA/TamA family outer membrane protein [Verrucomicrobiae bacterium]
MVCIQCVNSSSFSHRMGEGRGEGFLLDPRRAFSLTLNPFSAIKPQLKILSRTALLLLLVFCCAAGDRKPAKAVLKISGYGLLGDLRLKRLIRVMELGKRKPEFFDANFIEDSALILGSKLRDDGYLRPEIRAEITLQGGRTLEHAWQENQEEPLPRPLLAKTVHFFIRRGLRYHYAKLEFPGLSVLPAKRARAFFVETSGIIPLKQNRIYSPERLKRSVENLQVALNRLGYEDAGVTATNVVRNDRTGAVRAQVQVNQGQQFIVHSIRQEVFFGNVLMPAESRTNFSGRPYSKLWEQDYRQSVMTNYYQRGYPEVSVDLRRIGDVESNGRRFLDLAAEVRTGPRVRVGAVGIEGNLRTQTAYLKHLVPLEQGQWLDRMKAEQGRYRLSRLGAFDSVELNYQTIDTNLWDVTYAVKEGKRIEVSLLFGWGSWDLLRGGVEINQYDLWGLAHNQQLKVIQSFKTSSGAYTYTIPELLGQDADVFLNASGLRRQEISFTRVEYGGGIGIRRFFHQINTDTTVRYNYGILQATEATINFAKVSAQSPAVGEIITDLRHDRRDNPLYPHKGYDVLANVELATRYLGGDATFQRIELGTSYHWPLNDSEWIHLGLRHGVAATAGGTSGDLPFVRRFFPGGEDSVRGYQEGEASPRNAQGQIIGAETYLTGNVEFEQALTPKWSIVGFVDGVGFAERLRQ